MTEQHLKQRFFEYNSTQPAELVPQLWNDITSSYKESQRHYHTLKHLSDLFHQMDQVQHLFKNVPVAAMAIFYHDIVYQPGSQDNEERSAVIAVDALNQLSWKERDIREVAAYIRSTKTHQANTAVLNHDDLLMFLDIDLSVLGSDWDTYRTYSLNILKEFGNNAMVKWGRKGFMQSFLRKPQIYQTSYFRNKFETKARENIQREINELLK